MTEKLDLTVALITKNEEDRLPATLSSICEIASELVIVDSGSTDTTISIAKKFGAVIYSHPWEGFTAQKNFLTAKCTCKWILFLDADEVITSDLLKEIATAIEYDYEVGYEINRKTFYLGKILTHAWQPNFRLRLVKKSSSPTWIGNRVHEKLIVNCDVKRLNSFLIHYSYRNIKDHFSRTVNYASLSAQDYYEKGVTSSILKIAFKPVFSFFKSYFLKRSFLDGFPGFMASASTSFYVFLKYAMLYELQTRVK